MQHLCEHKDCCGCLSCYYSCKFKAITLVSDNCGFIYPSIDKNKCINCGACDRNCPIIKKQIINPVKRAIGARWIDKYSVSKSTSGGVATYFAKKFINASNIVYGVSCNGELVKYDRVTDLKGVFEIRGTKYTEPQKNFWKMLSKDIKNNRTILFIGTPCTIAAVKSRFNSYEKLFTCELICHGITSPRVLKEYIYKEELKNNSKVSKINVRYKKDGIWDPPYLKTTFVNGQENEKLFYNGSTFGYAFLNMSRSSCYNCKFKGENSWADITIGDYWGVNKESPVYAKEGVSLVLVRTRKGEELSKFDNTIISVNVNYNEVILHNDPIVKSIEHTRNSIEFTKLFSKYSLDSACKKSKGYKKLVFDNNVKKIKIGIKRLIKRVLYENK